MPYNTTAIPPRREATGQTQLPLTRVKKIVALDPDINVCSNNAAFIITLATEMFIQHLAGEAHNMAKMDRKPRRNVQYKDLSNAVQHQENLEFLQDMVPKTLPFKQIREQAAATQAKLRGERPSDDGENTGEGDSQLAAPAPNGKRQKSSSANGKGAAHRQSNGASVKGGAAAASPSSSGGGGANGHRASILSDDDPSTQLELEMRQAGRKGGGNDADDDVEMTG
ncbi:hypothetical protein GGTG_03757 [Gaeumannomyces tritici R3-111a-1]|uniref:Transcription factor CBF/NF-Y/archaeal histone domain-containing protein n=1 Tax=Gaeumannomyces tritici (strain R3-111a-1) TaxID=644352 RepID=J3NR52_GAET3|nr:hypothetical protein GGTG_03757 [Gaeumannomyces tritici R3-111a-1]EJT78658.1 hypothetical protein GGTG_03757 [Gaeumannomyces tritici R3-111a-1]